MGNEEIQTNIISTLMKAETSIKVAVAWLSDAKIIGKLREINNRGVKIDIIINDDEINKKHDLVFKSLIKSGLKIYYFTSNYALMHHKFCIIYNFIFVS